MVTNRWIEKGGDYSEALNIREKVFTEEQGCPEDIERDGYDKEAIHLVLYNDDIPVGCARIVIMEKYFKVGRIAVLKEHRGKYLGDLIVRLLLYKSFSMSAPEIRLGAQVQAARFYEKFGFERCGENYFEAGIEHTPMHVFVETAIYPSACHAE